YLSGACANKHVDSLQCIGEEKCEFSGLNVMTAKGTQHIADPREPHAKWLGLYCEEHRKFHCDCRNRPSVLGGRALSQPATRPRPRENDGDL
ncbi:MAG: hypothetical protein JW880_08540, partial [Candidatus Thermoplasmatota archaeon]|nr:hypothetical protein [Candidatus Thermoplasmatota archaeon]